LSDLFSREDASEIQYLMKRARRTGIAASQIEVHTPAQVLHLAVTVSALPAQPPAEQSFVVVLEDTSELLRAQKAAAWHEVARRIAHELKNPLTPIALSRERIGRQIERTSLPPEVHRIVQGATIAKEIESVKTLVTSSPSSHDSRRATGRCDLNDVVRAPSRFSMDDWKEFASTSGGLSPGCLRLDRPGAVQARRGEPGRQRRRSHADSLVKEISITTQPGAGDTIKLVIADSGCGVSADDKDRLFLPYFSTKGRGTGLGLAIVNNIVSGNAAIRVEDNLPVGARFSVSRSSSSPTKPSPRPKRRSIRWSSGHEGCPRSGGRRRAAFASL
jgi:nitrogen fixation/metabolism regulation signal transduction histidine kinase